jgi:hypothetical protein
MLYRIEQPFCLLQIRRIEALGEPTIDWRQQIARCRVPSLVAPKAGEVRAGAQLKQLRMTQARPFKCFLIANNSLFPFACCLMQLTAQSLNFRTVRLVFSLAKDFLGFLQCLFGLTCSL